jgi:uncharacterized protein
MLERETLNKIKNKLSENKILILLGSVENINEENLIQELVNDEGLKLFDVSNKNSKKNLLNISREEFYLLCKGTKNILIKDAQLLNNIQNIIEYVLKSELNLNLICLCTNKPNLDEVLLEVLESQELIIQTTSPTFKEIAKHFGLIEIEKNLEQRLIFGNHEQVFEGKEIAIQYLNQCLSKILKSTLNANERINKVENLRLLLQNIALTIGNHISYNELALKSNLDNETVERYIDLLVKSQVLIKLQTYSTDLKYELKKTHCIYFYDNGIRNAFIKNFNPLEYRDDKDELWKNWFISEKIKQAILNSSNSKFYFWVTHTKQKVDFIEMNASKITAYQMKWNKKEKNKFPKSFIDSYPNINLKEINRSTYWSFLAKD